MPMRAKIFSAKEKIESYDYIEEIKEEKIP